MKNNRKQWLYSRKTAGAKLKQKRLSIGKLNVYTCTTNNQASLTVYQYVKPSVSTYIHNPTYSSNLAAVGACSKTSSRTATRGSQFEVSSVAVQKCRQTVPLLPASKQGIATPSSREVTGSWLMKRPEEVFLTIQWLLLTSSCLASVSEPSSQHLPPNLHHLFSSTVFLVRLIQAKNCLHYCCNCSHSCKMGQFSYHKRMPE